MAQTFHLLKRVLNDGKPYIPAFLILGGVGLLLIPIKVYGLFLSRQLIDEGFLPQRWDTIRDILFLLILLFLLQSLIRYGTSFFSNKLQFQINQKFQGTLFSHILQLPMGFFTKEPTGQLMSRVLDDATKISFMFELLFGAALLHPFTLIALLGFLAYIHLPMCAVMIIATIFSLLIIEAVGRRLRMISKEIQGRNATIYTFVEQMLPNIELVKSKTTEEQTAVGFRHLIDDLIRSSLKMLKVRLISGPIRECLQYLALGSVFVYGGWLISQDLLSVGGLTTFLGATYLFFDTLNRLGSTYESLRENLARMEVIYGILDTPPERGTETARNKVHPPVESVEFEHVLFGYSPSRPVIKDVSFEIFGGDFLAITGQSGSGKTTLARLLLRFYEPDSGEIRLNGRPLRQTDLDTLRSAIGIVFQENMILNATIRENISYGSRHMPMERIIAAAKISGAHDFIETCPDLYETVIGEKGKNLSGGQRQRIAIARAVLTDPEILILDEATSFLELGQEEVILKGLKDSRHGKITMIISHRLSAVRMAERILTLDNGKILDTASQALTVHTHGD